MEIVNWLNFLDILKLRKVSEKFHQFISDHYIEKLNQFFLGRNFFKNQEFKLTNLKDCKLHIQIEEHLTQLDCSAEMQDAIRVEDWIKIEDNLLALKTKSTETKILTYLWKLFVDRADPKKIMEN